MTTLVYVDDSPIHGKGLFAKCFIPANSLIGTVQGEITLTDGEHVLWINDYLGIKVGCHLRYINHSDAPNAVYYDNLEVCTLRDIRPGEEITHDYQTGDDEACDSEILFEQVIKD